MYGNWILNTIPMGGENEREKIGLMEADHAWNGHITSRRVLGFRRGANGPLRRHNKGEKHVLLYSDPARKDR